MAPLDLIRSGPTEAPDCTSKKQYISLRLVDLQYLREMFHVVQNQLNVYTLCLPDVLSYVTVALTSPNYLELALNASRHIMYPHLFEDIKTLL